MSDLLFDDFPSVSAKEWKQRIQMELKGADFNEKLVTKTPEGIDVKPFYHKDETKVVSSAIDANPWSISEQITFSSPDETLLSIKEDVSRGAETIWLKVASSDNSVVDLLKNKELPKLPYFIEFKNLDENLFSEVFQCAKERNAAFRIGIDVFGNLARTGNWFTNQKSDQEALQRIAKHAGNIPFVLVDARLYQEAGGNQIQEIAYTLAHFSEYLNSLQAIDEVTEITVISSIGSNYFFEIAKFKALRWAVQSLMQGLGISAKLNLVAIPSKRNKTLYDYNVNMLRTTTEVMSAVLGGVNEVANLAYDNLYHKSNEFGKRIARNQLLLLKNEAHLDKVYNASDGAYYIEYLIEQMAEKALQLFKQIEAGGGLVKQLFEGKIQTKLNESHQKEEALFLESKRVLVGINKYANTADLMKDNLEKNPFMVKEKRKTLLQPIVERRLATSIEASRIKKEKANTK